MDLNPDKMIIGFNFIFQVWRPAPNVNETGCYSLIDDFNTTNISVNSSIGVARVTPSPADQPGDVLGFYVESHGEGSHPNGDANNGVALLTGGSYTNELVWYGSIGDGTAQMSETASCPYPIGASGVLSSSTHAAPVITVSITTYFCHQSFSTLVVTSSTPTPTSGALIHNGKLISGIVVFIIVCISAVTVVICIAIAISKRHRKALNQISSGIALSNQVYGELHYTIVMT